MLLELMVLLVILLVIWVVVSLPVFLASRVVEEGTSYTKAMLATLSGIVASYVVMKLLEPMSPEISQVAGFLATIVIYKAIFETGWAKAFAIAVIAIVVEILLVMFLMLLLSLLGIAIPSALWPPHPRAKMLPF